MLIDVHLHSEFSFDSSEKQEKYVKAAESAGIPAVGFSEHYDYDAFLDGADISLADLSGYKKNLSALRQKYPEKDILFGIEFGYSREAESEYKRLAQTENFDFIINSVHTLKGRGDCSDGGFFGKNGVKEVYREYFDAVLESLECGYDYQIVGHIGYVARYCGAPYARIKYSDYADILDEILNKIIERDKCLEINSSCGKSGNSFMPDIDVLQRYIELGGKKMSFGSDAHSVVNYLRGAEKLVAFLKSLGVDTLYYYKNRVAHPYSIV